MPTEADVIVVGAGAAGVTAAVALAGRGLSVTILEARDRIGGRIFTLHDAKHQAPVELGAEFIHGRPPEIWKLLKAHQVKVREVDGDSWCAADGRVGPCDFFPEVDKILKKMDDRKPDRSFLDFLHECFPDSNKNSKMREAKKWATGYVSGFNAADPALVGVHWLVQEMRAEEKIEGDRAFRAEHGYADLIEIFQKQLDESGVIVATSTVVEGVRWNSSRVEVSVRGANGAKRITAPRLLITVPLGVLQARSDEKGAIRFVPELPEPKRDAIRNVAMGKVIRVVLRFRERFWKDCPRFEGKSSKKMDGMSFLFSHDDWFPTWWTRAPEKLPFLTGWAPFHSAERLSGKDEAFMVEQAIKALHRLLGFSERELNGLLQHAYLHDWQSDPFSRGAYSYGKAGSCGAQEALAAPLANTLFFAGEATDLSGNTGTVHGAIATGRRAAEEIVKAIAAKNRTGKPPLRLRRKGAAPDRARE
jgi:monoamine oxidase